MAPRLSGTVPMISGTSSDTEQEIREAGIFIGCYLMNSGV